MFDTEHSPGLENVEFYASADMFPSNTEQSAGSENAEFDASADMFPSDTEHTPGSENAAFDPSADMHVCVPGLHISLGLFHKFFKMLEAELQDLDIILASHLTTHIFPDEDVDAAEVMMDPTLHGLTRYVEAADQDRILEAEAAALEEEIESCDNDLAWIIYQEEDDFDEDEEDDVPIALLVEQNAVALEKDIKCLLEKKENCSQHGCMEPGWTRAQWKIGRRKIPDVTAGYTYAPEKIFNMYESGLFYRTTTKRTLSVQGEQCAGGKQAKDRHVDVRSLPVTYRNNKTAWMTSDLFLEWLQTLDRKMHQQYRKILLFADNAPSQPDIDLENEDQRLYEAIKSGAPVVRTKRQEDNFQKMKDALFGQCKTSSAGVALIQESRSAMASWLGRPSDVSTSTTAEDGIPGSDNEDTIPDEELRQKKIALTEEVVKLGGLWKTSEEVDEKMKAVPKPDKLEAVKF
ncbi:TIGD4 [Branchiostoma lanceolatum]|uniref:TIGD4 protein n=1 Tax=Branchiostoma lanceolatum TaxID=7740 RepID=A0A8K0E7C9_BRALA|nr:TIGD4 [Branchiostoma lanceolatum]